MTIISLEAFASQPLSKHSSTQLRVQHRGSFRQSFTMEIPSHLLGWNGLPWALTYERCGHLVLWRHTGAAPTRFYRVQTPQSPSGGIQGGPGETKLTKHWCVNEILIRQGGQKLQHRARGGWNRSRGELLKSTPRTQKNGCPGHHPGQPGFIISQHQPASTHVRLTPAPWPELQRS
jgi:hypothetical protein